MECFTKPYFDNLKQLYPTITELYFVFKEMEEKQGNTALDNENKALDAADRVISTATTEDVCDLIIETGCHCEHVGFILGFTAAVKFLTEAAGQPPRLYVPGDKLSITGGAQA